MLIVYPRKNYGEGSPYLLANSLFTRERILEKADAVYLQGHSFVTTPLLVFKYSPLKSYSSKRLIIPSAEGQKKETLFTFF